MVGVNDPSIADPSTFIGPDYDKETAEKLAAEHGWGLLNKKFSGHPASFTAGYDSSCLPADY